jgi:hypothetical protein
MKTLVVAWTLGLAMSGALAAGSTYWISFTGTVTSGRASGFNPAISGNSLTAFADLTGARISGTLFYDLGVAPTPTATTDSSGFVNTKIEGMTDPVFMSETLSIEGFSIPAGFFAMPTVFDQPPVPAIPNGSALTLLQVSQSLNFATRPIADTQSVLTGMQVQTGWNGGGFTGGTLTELVILATSSQPFFPVAPAGSFPDNWGAPVPGQNGVFGFAAFSADTTIPQNFGITQWYDVQGGFSVDSASGGLFTPEPGTVGLVAMGVMVAAGVGRRRVTSSGRGRPADEEPRF